jgi:hypothetical protein
MLRTIDTWLISDATEVVALVEEVYQSLLGCELERNSSKTKTQLNCCHLVVLGIKGFEQLDIGSLVWIRQVHGQVDLDRNQVLQLVSQSRCISKLLLVDLGFHQLIQLGF